ncbi:hypothetical protein HNY73_010659 [Argiope bruennichi]|uniref:Uncharacterized protein n=1 Tax=Argiope bruennichi TaxID=94029 RepID=A0A8T0F1Q7_ARGBR|nr:hypothetical protein HNY73_010659 [Argiope bruennichi]
MSQRDGTGKNPGPESASSERHSGASSRRSVRQPSGKQRESWAEKCATEQSFEAVSSLNDWKFLKSFSSLKRHQWRGDEEQRPPKYLRGQSLGAPFAMESKYVQQ